MSRNLQVRPHPKLGTVPTGMALAFAILDAGQRMLVAPDRKQYLQIRDVFFELLMCADNDQVAGPFLADHVQAILDMESRLHHLSKTNG